MKSTFNSKEEAEQYKVKHGLLNRAAHPLCGTTKWGLSFPLACHVEVRQPHSPGLEGHPEPVIGRAAKV